MSKKDDEVKLNVEYTNASNDSTGSVEFPGISFSGNQFLVPLIALMISVALVVIFTATDTLVSLGPGGQWFFAFSPLFVSVAWMIIFVVNKPPRYQLDTFDGWLRGQHIDTYGATPFHGIFSRRAAFRKFHPLLVVRRKEVTKKLKEAGLAPQEVTMIVKDLEEELAS